MGPYVPNREEFCRRATQGTLIPVYREIIDDTDTPVSAFAKLGGGPYSFLLESVQGGEKWAAYSFIGVAPQALFTWRKGTAEVSRFDVAQPGGAPARTERHAAPDPAQALGQVLSQYHAVASPGLPRFFGGAVGYFGYDGVRAFERLPDRTADDLSLPECCFVITDTLVIFDNLRQSLKVVANQVVRPGEAPKGAYEAACRRIDAIVERLRGAAPPLRPLSRSGPESAARASVATKSTFSQPDFEAAVRKAKEYIMAGDAFQIVLSQRFEAPRAGIDPFDVYRALRVINPSPYLFHLVFPEVCVTGASPEVMVRLEGDRVELRPIAGTRPRGATEEEDRRLAVELLADPKERAEHIMLIDLGRNDLGRVCETGSVEVDEMMAIERYSHVMHIVSNVRGRLASGTGAIDVLRAAFPAGTLTGAPKIRAMEIIEELEPLRRGIYGGAIGYLSFTGNMDLAIAIRTLVTRGETVYVQAGAGLVAGSDPTEEYRETVRKASAVLAALEMAAARGS